jgi:adenosylhomocysteine nucleosidase
MNVGIIGAMNEEIEQMKAEMEITSTIKQATVTFYEGMLHGQKIVLCKSGVGKVNAALTTQILIDRFQVTHLVFTGVAGALEEGLDVGDLVISTTAMHHDIDASPLGFERGQIPMYEGSSDFKANEFLIRLAENAAKSVLNRNLVKGRILSGDQFVASYETVKFLRKQFNGVCVEMEGAAVAQVATMNNIPFVIVRSMSDKANGEATMSFQDFTVLASEQSYLLVKEMLKQL